VGEKCMFQSGKPYSESECLTKKCLHLMLIILNNFCLFLFKKLILLFSKDGLNSCFFDVRKWK